MYMHIYKHVCPTLQYSVVSKLFSVILNDFQLDFYKENKQLRNIYIKLKQTSHAPCNKVDAMYYILYYTILKYCSVK